MLAAKSSTAAAAEAGLSPAAGALALAAQLQTLANDTLGVEPAGLEVT